MSDAPQNPKMPNQRRHLEYEDPHYHDEDDVAPIEDDEPHRSSTTVPRRKPLYRPRRRFYEE